MKWHAFVTLIKGLRSIGVREFVTAGYEWNGQKKTRDNSLATSFKIQLRPTSQSITKYNSKIISEG